MEALSTRQFWKSSFVRGIMPVMAVALALLVVGACSSQPSGSARSRSAESVLVDGANDLGLDIGRRNDTYAAAMGEGLRGWLAVPARLRAFNWTMAALLVASLLPVLRL